MRSILPQPKIRNINTMILVGASEKMSLANNGTASLWKSFIPEISAISGRRNKDFISLQIFDPAYFDHFDPQREFTKWAAVEVTDPGDVPGGLKQFELNGGLYAVFNYRGMPGNPEVFHYIFSQWIPQSEFELDQRPHFEIMGSGYKNNSPDSEEDIYIPIKPK